MKYFIAVIMLWANAAHAGVGLRADQFHMYNETIQVRYFYPTDAPVRDVTIGVWDFHVAQDAPPQKGKFPMVVISHGFAANLYSHRDLAMQLASQGMVVVTLQHPKELLRVGTPQHLYLRPSELSAAIDMVLSDGALGAVVDQTRIGAFGFSLGGYTVLAAAGGTISFDRAERHCNSAVDDKAFCLADGGATARDVLLSLRDVFAPPPTPAGRDVFDKRIKAVVAAAPVGAPFVDLNNVTQPVLLFRAGRDGVLRYPYHAARVHALLPQKHRYVVYNDVGHLAFMSDIPEAMSAFVAPDDLHGPDQAAFLVKFNQEVTDFFRRELN